ncbi:MAG TPA: APC family permease [Actinocrinis sp.]|nr:APC family permease [Actinocrinis sp.]
MAKSTLAQPGSVSAALARDRLGVPSVVYFVLAGVAPLTVTAGVVTTAYAVTGLTSVPAAFIVVGVVLSLFSVGYVAMARHISNAGAFYAFISRGLGREAGVAGALIALLAYNLLQVGLYGILGPTAEAYVQQKTGTDIKWWIWSLAAWALVTALGLIRVDLSGRVLGVLLTLEVLVIIALTIDGGLHPAGGKVTFSTLNPGDLTKGGIGAVLAIAVLGYVGFEQSPVYAEEARDSRRTIPAATYFALAVIGVVYAAASWVMSIHYGVGNVAKTAASEGPGMLFAMGSDFLDNAGQVLFMTSLFAAALAFHNACWRYAFSLGREQVLPGSFGRAGVNGVPRSASALQSAVGLAVILAYAAGGWNPQTDLFFWLGTTGGFGVLILLALTSVAVVRYFALHPGEENLWRRVIAPGISVLVLLVMVYLCANNYSLLLGYTSPSTPGKVLPSLFAVAAVIGVGWALYLRSKRPEVYEVIGLGPEAPTAHSVAAGPKASAGSLAGEGA